MKVGAGREGGELKEVEDGGGRDVRVRTPVGTYILRDESSLQIYFSICT